MKRQALAKVAQNDLQIGKGVVNPREYQPQVVHAGIRRESPRGPRQLVIAVEVGFHDGRLRPRRMQVDRNIQGLRGLEDHPVFPVIQKAASRMAVDQGAFQSELFHGPLQFLGGLGRIGGRDGGKTAQSLRVGLNGRVHAFIGVARQRNRGCSLVTLRARRSHGYHLIVNASRVHVCNARFAEVEQLGLRVKSETPVHLGAMVFSRLGVRRQQSHGHGRRKVVL